MTSDAPLTVVLDGRGADSALVGGKAAMLDRLLSIGAPVPACGVVTTDAYRRFVADRDLATLLDRLRTEPIPSASEAPARQRQIDEAFQRAPMPVDVAVAISSLVDGIAGGRPVAVRSSATAEDERTASFAGQYRTSLDVPPGDLLVAVRACWASLWHPGVRAYRRFRGVDEHDLAMAALIMPMLLPDQAGVLFTVDPARAGALRIELVEGLGEALVAGARTPDVLVIERDAVEQLDPSAPVPGALPRLALELESAFGCPLDIEWAIEGGTIWLLQARPITTTPGERLLDDGFDVGDRSARYTTAGIAEMLPGVQSPRLWAINSRLIEEAFRELFAELGADQTGLDQAHALLGRFRGRAALDLDLMERVVESVPGGSAAELEHQYFGDVLDPAEAPAAPVSSGRLGQHIRTLRARAEAFRQAELAIQAIDRVLDLEPDLPLLEDSALLALRRRVLHLATSATSAEVAVAATAAASYRGLEMFLHRHLPDADVETLTQRLTATDRDAHRGRRALPVDALAAELAADARLDRARSIESWSQARAALAESAPGRAFLDRLSAQLRRAGSTSVFGGETWDQVPHLVWPVVRGGAVHDVGGAAIRRAEALAEVERRLAGEHRWGRALAGHLLDVRIGFLRREATDAAAFLERREHAKASLLMLGGLVWRIDAELGRRLAAHGAVEDPSDVELLSDQELEGAFGSAHLAFDTIAFRRRRLDAAQLEPPLPSVFRGWPGVPSSPPLSGDLIRGWPASPGRHEGRARVVRSPANSVLRRGDVLVARTTDSSWLPVFHIAGAVVVEQGGPLSHASILARELGMPAVVNLPGIVAQVERQSDPVLTVDGTTGEVAIRRGRRPRRPAFHAGGTKGGPATGVAPPSTVPDEQGADVERRHVFVTGLIGAGALMSIAIGATQAVGSTRARERIARRTRPRAEALAIGTVLGFDLDKVAAAGLRARGFYAWLGTVAGVFAVIGALWSIEEYFEQPAGGLVVVLMAFGMTTTLTLGAVSSIGFHATWRWPRVTATARRWSVPRVHDRLGPNQVIGRVRASLVGAIALTVAVLVWMVTEAEAQLHAVDQWIFDLVGAGSGRSWWYPEVLDQLLHKEIMIPLAVVLTAASFRCRPLLFVYPLVITGGGLIHLVLQHFVTRQRPEPGWSSGYTDSFPGGHANELTIMLGLLPIVVYVLTGRRWLRIALEIGSAAALAVALANQMWVGDHWPTDNLAGFLIGLSMVTIARGVVHEPALHDRCSRCPAQRRRRGEGP